MSLKEWIENNIIIFYFLYFLCTLGMIGIFLYIAWTHDLSDGTFFWGMLLLIYGPWPYLNPLRKSAFSFKTYWEGVHESAVITICGSGLFIFIAILMVLVDLEISFNTMPIILPFFGAVSFFWLFPLGILWNGLDVLQKLSDVFFFSYLVILPRLIYRFITIRDIFFLEG